MKNLLILRYLDTNGWDWEWATEQFRENRADLARRERHVGFVPVGAYPSDNGTGDEH